MTAKIYHRLAVALAVATVLFLILGMGALGIIGAGGRPDRMYLAVLVVGAVGTVAARLRPRGMAVTLAGMALVQVVVAVIALVGGVADEAGASVVDLLGLTAMYTALFALAAWLFWQAARRRSAAAVPQRG